MMTAAVYGLLASSGFLIGVIIGLVTSPPRRLIASVIAFGSGILVSALTFDLMDEAFAVGHPAFAIGGFLIGALIYVSIDYFLDRLAAQSPKREGRDPQDVVPDAQARSESPEQAAISGTALLVGTVSSSVGMRQEGHSRTYIIAVWSSVAIACTLAAVAGYALLGGLSPNMISAMLALAAGGILAMLADTMMPEAFQHGGPLVALATAVGFACAFLLSQLTH